VFIDILINFKNSGNKSYTHLATSTAMIRQLQKPYRRHLSAVLCAKMLRSSKSTAP